MEYDSISSRSQQHQLSQPNMETAENDNTDDICVNGYDSDGVPAYPCSTERWAPLGAAAVSPTPSNELSFSEADKLRKLEEEQDELNSSLLALTSHFAQVQFRLKQIINADLSQREELLMELENFAFKGIPDVRSCHVQDADILEKMSAREHEQKITEQREKQLDLINQLKSQLEDLETYAYESGSASDPPSNLVMEKQKVFLEELRSKLDLDFDNIGCLSPEEMKEVVNRAVASIINPAKVKEKVVEQLKTQIVDLERFIGFLQGETSSPGPLGKERCSCPVHLKQSVAKDAGNRAHYSSCHTDRCSDMKGEATGNAEVPEPSLAALIWKTLTLLQVYIVSQLSCGRRGFKSNMLKKTMKGNHWGDLRAKLELAVTHTLDLAQHYELASVDMDHDSENEEYTNDAEDADRRPRTNPVVMQCVRKELSAALRDLIQHGMLEINQQSGLLVPFGCFPSRSTDTPTVVHAWRLLIAFYDMKHGREYNTSPARMLSQSFHLDTVGGRPMTAKQMLLGAIDTVLKSHRRGPDSYFKAFVCLALNERKLVTWLRLLLRMQPLVDKFYHSWSYVRCTGFEDALQCLERLLIIDFCLPVDLAVRPFSNIRDAF